MVFSATQAQEAFNRAECLFTLEQVETAMDRMALEISQRIGKSDPLVLAVMNGGLIPAARLLSRFDFPLRQDYVHATRYRENTRGRGLTWVRKPVVPLPGRTVLIIDDILDEGYTLEALVQACREMGAASVQTAMLCEKQHDRGCDIKADFVALQVPDRYVFGYGMDYRGYLRNAPGIFALDE
ncbi:MAG: hypoxanthine-guanine phosphoribosyltransferase [Gammaproteobacteria bacterium]|nr:hypoxanthine-guanine phosphoribosyltransferase [Gammaproteobacteria bacterium]